MAIDEAEEEGQAKMGGSSSKSNNNNNNKRERSASPAPGPRQKSAKTGQHVKHQQQQPTPPQSPKIGTPPGSPAAYQSTAAVPPSTVINNQQQQTQPTITPVVTLQQTAMTSLPSPLNVSVESNIDVHMPRVKDIPDIQQVSDLQIPINPRPDNEKQIEAPPLAAMATQSTSGQPTKIVKKKPTTAPKVDHTRLKSDLIKIVRKPVKEHDDLFLRLKELTGDVTSKKAFVMEIIQEARKVKKAQLVAQLEAYEKSIV